MLEIILIVAVVVVFFTLNGRIRRLEDLAKKGGLVDANRQERPIASVTTGAVTDSSVFSKISEKVSTSSSSTTAVTSAVSHEEEGGRWLGKIGIIALLLGVSFFLKYAFDNNLIGVVGRVILGLVSGVLLVAVGQFLRAKYERYSDIIIGGGIGILYLTIYAAFAFYNLISQPTAFLFLFCVTALAVIISVVDKAFQLAALAVFGGFLTPFLISTQGNNQFTLFAYILILDIGVLAISFREKWLKLNYLAFIGTALIFLGWFSRFYSEDQLFSTLAFLSAYFLIFLIATVAHHLLRREVSSGSDLALVTLNAIAYFSVSYFMLDPRYHGFMGFFAVVLALLYFFLAYLSMSADSEDKFLNIYLSGLAVLFLTLAVPIQLTGSWITLAWLAESVVIAGFSTMVPRARFHAYGPVVFIIGLIKLFSNEVIYEYGRAPLTLTPFFNQNFFLFASAIIAAYVLGFFYSQASEKDIMLAKPKTLAAIFLVLANLITVYALTNEVSRIYDQKIQTEYAIQNAEAKRQADYRGDNYYGYSGARTDAIVSLQNQKNTAVSILWALYAIALTIIGFAARSKIFRSFGLIFFFVTAFKILIDVWSLGQLYRIISSIAFGVIALLGSFAYAKYKDRIKQIINE